MWNVDCADKAVEDGSAKSADNNARPQFVDKQIGAMNIWNEVREATPLVGITASPKARFSVRKT